MYHCYLNNVLLFSNQAVYADFIPASVQLVCDMNRVLSSVQLRSTERQTDVAGDIKPSSNVEADFPLKSNIGTTREFISITQIEELSLKLQEFSLERHAISSKVTDFVLLKRTK